MWPAMIATLSAILLTLSTLAFGYAYYRQHKYQQMHPCTVYVTHSGVNCRRQMNHAAITAFTEGLRVNRTRLLFRFADGRLLIAEPIGTNIVCNLATGYDAQITTVKVGTFNVSRHKLDQACRTSLFATNWPAVVMSSLGLVDQWKTLAECSRSSYEIGMTVAPIINATHTGTKWIVPTIVTIAMP